MKEKFTGFIKDCFGEDRANILFFLGLVLLLLWMPMEYGARYLNTQVVGQVICGGLLLLAFREKVSNIFKYPLWSISMFWIGILSTSLIVSVSKLATLEEVMRNLMYISLPMIIYSWTKSNNRIKLISFTVLITGLCIGSTSIYYVLKEYLTNFTIISASEPFGRTNDFGAYMLLIFPLALSSFLYEEKYLEKFIYSFITVISLIGIITTFSRGIWLSVLLGIILILILGFKIIKRNLIYLISILLISIIPIIINRESIVNRFLSLQNVFNHAENSLEWRKSLLKGCFNIFLDNPVFGTGLNSFPYVFSYYQEKAGYFSINPHNYYLQLLAETGVIGFFTFSVLSLSILYMSYKAFKNSEKIFKGIALGLLVGIISSLIHISVDIDWSVSAIPILFWIEVGLLISIYSAVGFKETRFSDFNNRFEYIKKPALFIIAIALITIPVFNYASLQFFLTASKELKEGNLDTAEKYNMLAMRLAPIASARHHNNYALIMFKKNNLEKALEYSEKAVLYDKYNYNYNKTKAEILMEISPNNKEKALETLLVSIKMNPYIHPKLYNDLGEFYTNKLNNKEEAIKWSKLGIQRFPITQIPNYELYTPSDRFQLYKLYKDLARYIENDNPKESKEYKRISEFLLSSQAQVGGKLGELTSTPTNTIKSYWNEVSNYKVKEEDLNKYVKPNSQVFHPPLNFSYKFLDFMEIEHNIYSITIQYKVRISNKNSSRDLILIDTLVNDENGWVIALRDKKN